VCKVAGGEEGTGSGPARMIEGGVERKLFKWIGDQLDRIRGSAEKASRGVRLRQRPHFSLKLLRLMKRSLDEKSPPASRGEMRVTAEGAERVPSRTWQSLSFLARVEASKVSCRSRINS
jgi:hypothetical protein